MAGRFSSLARFANLLATAPSSAELQQLLVDTAVDVVGAHGAVLLVVEAGGTPRIAARRSFTAELVPNADLLGAELAHELVAASAGAFTSAAPLPLVAAGGLYGVLALLFRGDGALDDEQLEIASTIADIAAATLARARETEELELAYEELQASKRALLQAEKLRALGGMAAGVSHDLKNVFAPMLMLLDVLKDGADDGNAMREHLEMMRRPLENGLAIVDRLRGFSRHSSEDGREIARLESIVSDAMDLCSPRVALLRMGVELQRDLGAAPLVRMEVADAMAVVTNLIVNALDAVTGAGGVVTVRTGAADGGSVVEVTDNGPGVPAHIREKIFDSFFTTKGKAGTGLGLAMARDFAQRHGGKLSLDSPESGGARFTLWLPAAQEPE